MTKKELLNQLKGAISKNEWNQIQKKELPISEFNCRTLQEMAQASVSDMEKSIDEQLAEDLSHVLKEYLSQHLSDKPEAWQYLPHLHCRKAHASYRRIGDQGDRGQRRQSI